MEANRVPGRTAQLWRRAVACIGALACLALACAGPANADERLAPEAVADLVLRTPVGKSAALKATGPIGRVVVSQPDLVEVGLAGPDQLYVIGRERGSANLLVYDRAGRLSQTVDLRVGYDVVGLQDTLAAALPERNLQVTGLSAGLLVEGEVATAAEAKAVEAIAERAAPDSVISRLQVQDSVVRVDVHIAEVSTQALKALGAALLIDDGHVGVGLRDAPISLSPPHAVASLDTHVGDYRLAAALRALEEVGEARIVAQPMLVVASGERGDFRAGGELPFPVPQDRGQIIVEFRPYGVGLKVTPTAQANGLVQLRLEAELSEVDPQNQVTLAGVQVPSLLTRRVSSVAELRSGETMMLAGLLQRTQDRRALQTPWLERIPLLGPLFRGSQARDTQRELAIFVTPRVGEPTPATLEAVREAAVRARLVAAPQPSAPIRPAVKGPRGPPQLRAVLREFRDVVAPPARWLVRLAKRAAGALA